MQDLNLSKEEIALIQEKRANDLDSKKLEAIQSAEKSVSEYISENNRLVDAYKEYFNKLIDASMSKGCGEVLFELVTEIIDDEETPYFYNDGFERVDLTPIKYTIVRCKIKYIGETVKHIFRYIDEDGDEMCYHGDTPVKDNAFRVDAKYSIEVYEKITGWGFSQKNHGFFMKIDGLVSTGNRNNGQKISNGKSVVNKIKEDIKLRKILVESDERKRSLKVRAIQEAKNFFPNGEVSEYNNKITVNFENGSSIVMRYYDEENEVSVKFVTDKISAPYNLNPITIGNFLEKM